METREGQVYIRANQGHSFEVPELSLTCITDASKYPIVVHGTYKQHWDAIKATGLSKMGRNHVHCAKGLCGDNVISGMRTSCEVYIFINLEQALSEGLRFFESANGVVLCEHIPPHLFKYVLTKALVPFDPRYPTPISDTERALLVTSTSTSTSTSTPTPTTTTAPTSSETTGY
ncbi:tRNA 2'-phosphotransferase 1 [Pelomyxa schiedti]|nr:tRNA 2'-phosphotransferase 1 [Pelomyxa schiedti]